MLGLGRSDVVMAHAAVFIARSFFVKLYIDIRYVASQSRRRGGKDDRGTGGGSFRRYRSVAGTGFEISAAPLRP